MNLGTGRCTHPKPRIAAQTYLISTFAPIFSVPHTRSRKTVLEDPSDRRTAVPGEMVTSPERLAYWTRSVC